MSKNTSTLNDPRYHDMPERKPLLVLSWEDIVAQAEHDGKTLTRDQVIEVFERLRDHDLDCIMDGFWWLLSAEIDATRREEII